MANFIKNFKKPSYETGFLPDSVLKELESVWNGQFRYEYDKHGSYFLTPVEKRKVYVTLENFEIENMEEIKKKCKKDNMTIDDFLKYSYNAQKPLFLSLKKNFKISLDNIDIKEKDMVISSEGQINYDDGNIIIYPKEMDYSLSLYIGNGEKEYLYTFIQKPMESLEQKRFISINESKISIDCIIDKNKLKFDMTVNHKNMQNAQEYFNTLTFMQSLFEKGIYINGKQISFSETKDSNYEQRNKLIDLWKKIMEIEQKLDINFSIKKYSFDNNEYLNICLLYRTLIEKKPVRSNQKVKNLSFDMDIASHEELDMLMDMRNKNHNFCLECSNEKTFEVLDKNIIVYQLKTYFNLYISDIQKIDNKKKYIVTIEETEGDKMFNSTMIFKTLEELEKFLKGEKHIDILYNASELFDS